MRKFLTIIFAALAAVSVNAQISDAADYFTNKPFGWATCANTEGKAFNMNGGVGYGEPKTITLTASGADDDTAIKNAIAKYDIIILDGSKGDFTIAAQMKIIGASNKTIVGINGARLCTKFWITPEIHAALVAAHLDQYSGSNQITATLPNGQTLTCDERAFYTKKTMIEATGDMTMSFAQSGIFAFDGSDENIILRNLVFQGPGAVDVDAVDLVSQYGGNHIWIDHCEFIDGMDGNLDTGKREGLFVTYSWNIFRYTERSYSHPYSNGCGWLDSTDPQLFITYANCIWGAGCGRRLPQVGATHLHLLNCYYDCAGNSMGCTVNGSNTVALIEGNYSEQGVSNPLSFSNDVRAYTVRGNYFATAPAFNSDREKGGGVSVPYDYSVIPYSDLRDVLLAQHGAGATLDNDNALPEVEPTQKPDVNPDGDFTTVHNWNFKNWSSDTKSAMQANSADWSPDGSNFSFNHTTSDYVSLVSADGLPFPETDGLLFKFGSANQAIVYYSNSNKGSIRINKSNIYIKVPNCHAGDKLIITLKSANNSTERGLASNQTLPKSFVTIKETANEMLVVEDGDVELYSPQGGIYLLGIELQRQGTTGIAETIADNNSNNNNSHNRPGQNSSDGNSHNHPGQQSSPTQFYNLQGQKVLPTQKGLLIINGKKYLR